MLYFNTLKNFLCCFTVVLILPFSGFSQKGEIVGIIVDSKAKETLIGANITIEGTSLGVSTDIDGKFKLENITPDTYNIVVSYISYETQVIENVKVEANRTTDLGRIFLKEDTQMLEGVTVSERAKTDTDVSMISSIQNSNITVSGISRQQISKSMDKNAAEAIRRVPGVTITEGRFVIVRGLIDRYNTVWLNNASTPSHEADKKSFSFDVIPSSALDRLLVYKTPAPELQADFAGASIMVFTKNLPEENKISVGYSAGYRFGTSLQDSYTYEGGKTDWLGFDDGTRSIPKEIPSTEQMAELYNWEDLGLPYEQTKPILDAKRAKLEAAGRSFNKIWDPHKKTTPIDHSFGVDFNRKMNWGSVQAGNITSLVYRNEHLSTTVYKGNFIYNEALGYIDTNFTYYDDVYLNNIEIGLLHNWSFLFKDGTLLEFRNLINQIGQDKYTYRQGYDFYREAYVRSHELNFMERTTYSGQLSAKHNLTESSSVDATFGFAYSNRNNPDIRRIYSVLNENPNSQYFGRYAVAFINDANPELNGRLFLGLDERIYTAAGNYQKKFDFNGWNPEIKAGIYYETKNRNFNARNLGFVKARVNDFDQSIQYIEPYSAIYADSNIVYPDGIMLDEKTDPSDSYKATNDLLAGYVTLGIPIGGLVNIYGGLRIESNSQKLFDFYPDLPGYDSLDVVIDTVNLFPSVNVSFDITEKSKIRLAYGMTINRPEFREIAPYAYYDFETASQMYGNPALTNAYIYNYDLRYEWYPSAEEIITIGAFFKQFKDPIESTLIPASTDKWTFLPENAQKAEALGAELDIKKSFRFLEKSNGFFRNFRHFVLVFNASIIRSKILEGKTYQRDEERPMQGQSPYIVNTGLYYDNPELGLSASLLYNIIGERIIYVGDPQTPHTYEQPRNDLELAISKKIGKYITLTGGFENIFDEPYELTQTIIFDKDTNEDGIADTSVEEERILKSFKAGRKIKLGVTFTF